ncbi:MAG TPA: hypothetical protein VGO11_21990 [Chthoniobacteraceae bacterium]|jgi:hypothetical protein|nr:hypothetical protein [Chthoniobacteraceae bacterium]
MSKTLTLEPSGSLVIPPELLNPDNFPQGVVIELEETEVGLLVRPVQSERKTHLVRNADGDLVLASGRRITDEDVIAAIAADRK